MDVEAQEAAPIPAEDIPMADDEDPLDAFMMVNSAQLVKTNALKQTPATAAQTPATADPEIDPLDAFMNEQVLPSTATRQIHQDPATDGTAPLEAAAVGSQPSTHGKAAPVILKRGKFVGRIRPPGSGAPTGPVSQSAEAFGALKAGRVKMRRYSDDSSSSDDEQEESSEEDDAVRV